MPYEIKLLVNYEMVTVRNLEVLSEKFNLEKTSMVLKKKEREREAIV